MFLSCVALLAGVPTLAYRWVYLQTNLFPEESVPRIEGLLRRAAKAGYNGLVITDTKMQSLAEPPPFYRERLARILATAKSVGVEVVPAVLPVGYAGSMLAHNPNLVEAMPVRDAVFRVKGGAAELEADPEVKYLNGGFEEANGDKLAGLAFQDGIGKASFVDRETVHSGKASLRFENPGQLTEILGNARVMQEVRLKPWRHYLLSAWVKTEGFDRADSVRATVLNTEGQPLSFQELALAPTQEWTQVHVTFNSQERTVGRVYLGVWGGNKGKLWFDDVRLEELGPMNVVRRPGAPVKVVGADGTTYVEGRDFEPLRDPKSGTVPWPGEFETYHAAPSIKLIPGGRPKEGEQLRVSWHHAQATEHGKTAICFSEPEYRELARREIRRIGGLFQPKKFFLAHDEIRVMNWCEACRRRGISPAKMLDEDVNFALREIKATRKGAEAFIWSDMFDPFHNAVADYYLVNGDLRGAGSSLPPSLTIVNWNSGRPANSLAHFAKRGHRQILAGYYDSDPAQIKAWLADAAKVKGVVGVMYTTWSDKYDDLEAFARAAWGSKTPLGRR